jgi:O-methyltransferase
VEWARLHGVDDTQTANTHIPVTHSLIPADDLAVMLRVAETAPPGAFVEVGVYQGGSARGLYEIAERQGRTLWLFDTFTGHPAPGEHDHPNHPAGRYSDCGDAYALSRKLPDAMILTGRFPQECPKWVAGEMAPVAFAHIDVDLYESTRDSIAALLPLMAPNGIMYFDDYGAPDCPGATRAVREIFGDSIGVLENGKAVVRCG